jgi:hypothetical protein
MTLTSTFFTALMLISLLPTFPLSGQKTTEAFEFQFEQKTLRGLIEKPPDRPSRAVVILIPGYGKTDFVEGNRFSSLRNKLVEAGLTVCVSGIKWDMATAMANLMPYKR